MSGTTQTSFALWTRIAVQQLIKKLWEIEMPISTVGEYLKGWGYTPQKPFRKAYEQNPKAVKKWLDEQYLSLRKELRKKRRKFNGVMKWL